MVTTFQNDAEWLELIKRCARRFGESAWDKRCEVNPKLAIQRVKKHRFLADCEAFILRYANSARREGLPEFVILATLAGSIDQEFRVGAQQLLKGLPQMIQSALEAQKTNQHDGQQGLEQVPSWKKLLEARLEESH